MANTQTAEEWKTVAANAQAQLDAVSLQKAQGEQQISALGQQLLAQNKKISEYLAANPIFSKTTLNALEAEKTAITRNLDNTTVNVRSSLVTKQLQLRADIRNANTQAETALAGPPGTSPNTPPATDQPNTDPTTVTTIPAPTVESGDTPDPADPADDPFETARLANEEQANVPVADIVLTPDEQAAADDPFEQRRLELEQEANREELAQQATEAEPVIEDPFETARRAAEEQADIPANEIVLTPAEQAAADDPFEQRRLELEQQANRDELAREENLNVGNDDPDANRTNTNADLEAQQAANRAQLQAEDAQDLAAQKSATLDRARAQNTIANQRRNPNNGDWRVKLRLAPGANYLYNADNPGILQPLKGTGIIFPYTPTISTAYKANYSSYDLTHSNYKGYYYQSSAVEPVTLSCPFTAQSTPEAEYLLAVIHFFKSVTKMFYGQDPERGTPPPLVYLTGLGEFQFNEHPCVVQSFTYDLPTDVDYIRARSQNVNNSNMLNKRQSTNPTGPGTTWGGGILGNVLGGAINRLANAGLPKGGMNKQPAPASFGQNSPTYVPTKINISISLLPVQSRKQQSQQFSLRQYANGDLLKGGFW